MAMTRHSAETAVPKRRRPNVPAPKGWVPNGGTQTVTPKRQHPNVLLRHGVTSFNLKVIGADTLNCKPIFDPPLKKLLGEPPSPVGYRLASANTHLKSKDSSVFQQWHHMSNCFILWLLFEPVLTYDVYKWHNADYLFSIIKITVQCTRLAAVWQSVFVCCFQSSMKWRVNGGVMTAWRQCLIWNHSLLSWKSSKILIFYRPIKSTAGPGETFSQGPPLWEKILKIFYLKWCIFVYFIFLSNVGPPKCCRLEVTYSLPSLLTVLCFDMNYSTFNI